MTGPSTSIVAMLNDNVLAAMSIDVRRAEAVGVLVRLLGARAEDPSRDLKAALLCVSWHDRLGSALKFNDGNFFTSDRYGVFRYVPFTSDIEVRPIEIQLQAPPSAAFLTLRLIRYGNPSIDAGSLEVGRASALGRTIQGSLRDENQERIARDEEVKRIWSANLDDIHTSNCTVLPSRERLLEMLPKNGVAAELGVAFGDFSQEISNRLEPKVLFLIDYWLDDGRYSAGRERVKQRFAKEIASGDVVIREGYSTKVLENFADGFFDFIYIDTAHSFDVTLAELEVGSRKVKASGVLAGHDFCTGNVVAPVVYGVIQACSKFCRENNWRYKYLTLETGGSFSFCLERIPAKRTRKSSA